MVLYMLTALYIDFESYQVRCHDKYERFIAHIYRATHLIKTSPTIIPAKARIEKYCYLKIWIPALAGMTKGLMW